MGVSQSTPGGICAAITVAARDLDTEASWNTVSASTASLPSTRRRPKPFAYTVWPPCTTETATPGTPVRSIHCGTRVSSRVAAWRTVSALGSPPFPPPQAAMTEASSAAAVAERKTWRLRWDMGSLSSGGRDWLLLF
jgi:hypothetical protein